MAAGRAAAFVAAFFHKIGVSKIDLQYWDGVLVAGAAVLPPGKVFRPAGGEGRRA